MATSVPAPSTGDLTSQAFLSSGTGTPGPSQPSTFPGVDPDETGVPAEEGAKGVITPDIA